MYASNMTYKDNIDPQVLKELVSYDYDTGFLSWKPRPLKMFCDERAWKIWNTRYANKKITSNRRGYIGLRLMGKNYFAHRVIWAMHYEEWPKNQIDHINGKPDDNRLDNLRDVGNSVNHRNLKLPSNNTSGRIGVCFYKKTGKWKAEITVNKKYIFIGMFDKFDDACAARKNAEEVHGFLETHGRAGFPSCVERGRTWESNQKKKRDSLIV